MFARKSGNYAAVLTFGLLLAVNAALLLPRTASVSVPLGDMPLTMEIRRLPPPAPPVAEPEPEPLVRETRKLLSETPEPDRLVVPEPPAPPKVEQPKPAPKPVEKARKKPEKRREAPPVRAEVPPAPPMAETAPAPAEPATLSAGHASGQADTVPDTKGAVLAALLRAVEANKEYPRQARRAGIEGKTVLKVTIGADGKVTACILAEASGKKLLDVATEKLGAALLGLEIPPARGRSMSVLIPVRYALKRS